MAQFLITGGCGFIGSHLADALLAQSHDVRVLDNLSTGHRENLPEQAELMIGDVADRVAVRQALKDIDGIFHLAAIASVARSNDDWVGTHVTNLTGAITIFDAARTARQGGPIPVVYASSAAVYGHNGNVPLSEDDATVPMTAYGADKLGCELHAHVATAIHRVPTTGLRFFNVYGSRQDPNSPYSGVISIFCDRLSVGDSLNIYGDGQQVRDFIHVSDVVATMIRAMDAPMGAGEVYNVCTGTGTTVLQLAHLLAELCGKSPSLKYLPSRAGDVKLSIGDPAHARSQFGIEAKIALRDGLRDTLAAHRARLALQLRYA